MKKVIIVDDEAAGRKLIREYMSDFPELVLVGEANNGVDAVKMINEFKPDLIFLDINMPGMNGFEMLAHLEELPQIIFSTAYDQYALKAFDVHAIDYLLKPYTRERFKQALEHVRIEKTDVLLPLAEQVILEQAKYPKRIIVQSGKKYITIATENIQRIEAWGDYCRMHTLDQVYISNFGISQLVEKLNPDTFIRVHRSTVINIHSIKEINKFPGGYDVVMLNKDIVNVSRSYIDNLRKLMF
ncbi:LytR/AlgR family response regulator transcription factor [Flavobacterium subsaxonicum]|uniref:LytTR family transcriptional regulator n=1 Tax=Flavobacterium subsaxonicum WB 4.1-42 = DSM 21790 TaxID=1121898 RepID=A0A0A2MQV4_9FLAO|nr:response regulator [Flavobacterium subsaxonicum]KGO94674.1 LytTR family transcriptional regulator [Flavobacterium subsaxonicum WB 4.1-42 = DSM 21790]